MESWRHGKHIPTNIYLHQFQTYQSPQIWDLLENKHLFNALDEDGDYSPSHHVAEMVGFLGLPPSSFIERSRETRNVFTDDG